MTVNEKELPMGATCGARIRRRRQELGMTQLDLAERTGLSEAAVRSYELGTRNPKDAHREAIAEALGVSANYLRENDGYHESEIVHFLMEMEDAGFLRPVLIDGTAYVMPVQTNLEDGIQEWAEKERDWRFEKIGEEEYLRWKASYDPAGAQRRIASGGANSHFDWDKAKMGPKRMEEELAKLPSENDREAIRSALENHNEKKHSCKDGRDDL